MRDHHSHHGSHHGSDTHGRAAQGHVGHHGAHHVHAPPPDALGAYTRAHDAAQPAPGGRVVRVDLDAREADWEFVPGRSTRVWGYDGQVPGPVLEARVGDVLEVRLTNVLPEATTIHWHGLRLPAPMDGTENVQHLIAPGETFTYRYFLPDAGTFWYHPHTNETEQLERGLYGALVVRGPDEPRLDAERVLVLDDVKLDREGQIERWRIVNAASARYVRLSLGGRPFTLLGTDGGLIAAPVPMTQILLAPADRVEIAVGPFAEGETIPLESLRYDRRAIARPKTARFATVRVGAPQPSRAEIPPTLRHIERLVTGPVRATREMHLGVRPSLRTGAKFVVNGEAHHRDEPVRVGDLQVWDVVNDTLMDHPFHLHGFFFQVVSVNGEPPAFLSWEDTVNVPPRSRMRIAWLPDDRPGEWMYHCHILEHHASGMMGHFEVIR